MPIGYSVAYDNHHLWVTVIEGWGSWGYPSNSSQGDPPLKAMAGLPVGHCWLLFVVKLDNYNQPLLRDNIFFVKHYMFFIHTYIYIHNDAYIHDIYYHG